MAHRGNIRRLHLKSDKNRIITEYSLCYYICYINNYILYLQAEMDSKLMLTEKEIPSSHAYDYTAWQGRVGFSRFLLISI